MKRAIKILLVCVAALVTLAAVKLALLMGWAYAVFAIASRLHS